MYSNARARSLFRRMGSSVAVGFLILFAGIGLDRLVSVYGLSSTAVVADNVIVGIIAGLVVFGYEQRRHRFLLEKLRIIAEMNHHVRNALQAIMYAPQTSDQQRVIRDSVQRIEWALKEVLPGKL